LRHGDSSFLVFQTCPPETAVLALIIALFLTACAGNDTDIAETTTTLEVTTTAEPTTTSPSQDPTSDNGGDTTPGANNPLYDLPAGFETHPQDGEYFYATTDDYVVAVIRCTGTQANVRLGEYYGDIVTEYFAYSFKNDREVDYANQYAASRQDCLAIGNIVYHNPKSEP
jgi:hypothetical protein